MSLYFIASLSRDMIINLFSYPRCASRKIFPKILLGVVSGSIKEISKF